MESASANATVGHVPASKTILVVGLGMVGIGEHGRHTTNALLFILFPSSVYREASQLR